MLELGEEEDPVAWRPLQFPPAPSSSSSMSVAVAAKVKGDALRQVLDNYSQQMADAIADGKLSDIEKRMKREQLEEEEQRIIDMQNNDIKMMQRRLVQRELEAHTLRLQRASNQAEAASVAEAAETESSKQQKTATQRRWEELRIQHDLEMKRLKAQIQRLQLSEDRSELHWKKHLSPPDHPVDINNTTSHSNSNSNSNSKDSSGNGGCGSKNKTAHLSKTVDELQAEIAAIQRTRRRREAGRVTS